MRQCTQVTRHEKLKCRCARSVPANDEELVSTAKHWGRTGIMFCWADELDDAQHCMRSACELINQVRDGERINVLQARCTLKGWEVPNQL